MNTKLLLAAAIAASIPASAMAQRAPAASILIVDTDRVLSQCTACVAASAALQAQDRNFQARRQALLGPIQTEEQSLQQAVQAAQRLTGAARTTAENALRPRLEQFDRNRTAAARELQTLQQNFESTRMHVSAQLNQRLDPIYTQVMNSRGANLIISVDARLAHVAALDATNDVLAQLNRQVPSVSITPLPAQQQPAQQPSGR